MGKLLLTLLLCFNMILSPIVYAGGSPEETNADSETREKQIIVPSYPADTSPIDWEEEIMAKAQEAEKAQLGFATPTTLPEEEQSAPPKLEEAVQKFLQRYTQILRNPPKNDEFSRLFFSADFKYTDELTFSRFHGFLNKNDFSIEEEAAQLLFNAFKDLSQEFGEPIMCTLFPCQHFSTTRLPGDHHFGKWWLRFLERTHQKESDDRETFARYLSTREKTIVSMQQVHYVYNTLNHSLSTVKEFFQSISLKMFALKDIFKDCHATLETLLVLAQCLDLEGLPPVIERYMDQLSALLEDQSFTKANIQKFCDNIPNEADLDPPFQKDIKKVEEKRQESLSPFQKALGYNVAENTTLRQLTRHIIALKKELEIQKEGAQALLKLKAEELQREQSTLLERNTQLADQKAAVVERDDRIENLEKQFSGLKRTLKDTEKKHKKAIEKLKKEHSDGLRKKENRFERNKNQLEEKIRTTEKLQRELAEVRKQQQNMPSQLEETQQQLKRTGAELEEANANLAAHKRETTQKEKEIESLRQETSALKKQREELATLKAQLDTRQKENMAKDQTITGLRKQLSSKQQKPNKDPKMQSDLAHAQKNLKELRAALQKLQEEKQALADEKAAWERQSAAQQNEKAQLEAAQQQITQLQTAMQASQKIHDAKQEKYLELESQVAKLKADLVVSQKKVEVLQKAHQVDSDKSYETRSHASENSDTRELIKVQNGVISDQKEKIADLKKRNTQLEQQHQTLRDKYNNAVPTLEKLIKENDDLHARLDSITWAISGPPTAQMLPPYSQPMGMLPLQPMPYHQQMGMMPPRPMMAPPMQQQRPQQLPRSAPLPSAKSPDDRNNAQQPAKNSDDTSNTHE